MAYKYLSGEHLVGFENYKYNAVDTNPISVYVMHPFWNHAVKLCPRWLAPNLMTFVGFLLTVLNFVVLSYYDYYFYASNSHHPEYPPIPHSIWLICAIFHFLAYTLDGIDGKQARRTQTSGPLGEMFDHGLDSWTTVFIPCCLFAVFGRDDYSISVLEFYGCLWVVQLNFLSSHWEKYNTGVLYLPWGYDMSEIVCFIVFVISYFTNFTFWKFTIPIVNISPGIAVKYMLYAGSLGLCLPMSIYNIYMSYVNKTGKMRSFYEGHRPLVSFFVFMALCFTWVFYSKNDVFHLDPRCFYVMTGTLMSNICCRLIVSQMTNTRCELLNWLLIPAAVTIGVSCWIPMSASVELALLYALTSFITLSHIHYGTCVVRQMCDHFQLDCFRIKRKED